jgi:hypothetical protein
MPKNFKEYWFEGATNYTPARGPHMFRAKSVLQKVDLRVWAVFIYFNLAAIMDCCEHGNEPSGSIQYKSFFL